jgi:thymidine kinase
MFSGKTSQLILMAENYAAQGRKLLVLKHKFDTRYDVDTNIAIVNHNGERYPARAVFNLMDVPILDIQKAEIILVDEGQFFSDLIEFAERVSGAGRLLVVAGLDLTFQKQPFGQILELAKRAAHVSPHFATCYKCGKLAEFTVRKTQNLPTGLKGEVVVVGGAELYQPACRECFSD